MLRRTAVLALSAGVLPILARAAYAQEPANMVPRDLGQYRTMTLTVGSLALQSSQLASQRATLAKVKQFAEFETAEQLTLVLRAPRTGLARQKRDVSRRRATSSAYRS